jgi:hypothetical protein
MVDIDSKEGGYPMRLQKELNRRLQQIPSDQAAVISVSDSRLGIDLHLSDWNRLGCLLEGLTLERRGDAQLSLDPTRIVEQITYLEESLSIIETEIESGRAILRSSPPRINDCSTSFFEVDLDQRRGLILRRYTYDRDLGERFPVAAPLSSATLERLISDLIQLAG